MSAATAECTTDELCGEVMAAVAALSPLMENIAHLLEGAMECKNTTDIEFLQVLTRVERRLSSLETRLESIDQKLVAVLRPRAVV